ncbi:MAG: alcohol dehydrogenase catalytic domain-containing protein [bacterium]|nr:alcohol dehydrogenase catalytic domain-containing protein [bacterium]
MSEPNGVRYGEEVKKEMEAVFLNAPNELEVGLAPTPVPLTGEVLVKVESTTICGTDIEIIKGNHAPRWPSQFPAIIGHEWAGRIVAMGPHTEGFGLEMGDHVAGTSHAGCGACRMCLIGRYNLCYNYGNTITGHRQYGHVSQGSYAEYVANNIRALHKMPKDMPFEVGSVVDPAACGLWTAKRAGINAGDTVVVLGSGPIGVFAFESARALGAGRVIVVGGGKRLEMIAAQGVETVSYREGGVPEKIHQMTDGKKANVVLETAGTSESFKWTVECAGKGARIAITGIPDDIPDFVWKRVVLEEMDIFGVRANPNCGDEVIAMIQGGRIQVTPYITHRFPLRQYQEAYDTFVARKDGAMLVNLTPGA